MIKKIKLALVLATGLAVISTRAASYMEGELVIGFTAQVGNDFEYNLGSASAITNGQTWNLSSQLTGIDLVTVKWGVIGSSSTPETAWTTKPTGTPVTITSTKWNKQNLAISSIYGLFTSSGAGASVAPSSTLANSWNQQTIVSSLSTSYRVAYQNPNVTGLAANKLYLTLSDSSAPTLVGTFSLAANGVVTFTAASSAPPAPTLNISRVGSVSSISFLSANSATYTLLYTNSTGLTAPVTTWPVLAGTITGDGTTKTFTDTTAATERFYKVKAQ